MPSRTIFRRDKIRRPEILLEEFFAKGMKGMFKERGDVEPFMFRAQVLDIYEEGETSWEKDPPTPLKSIKARIVSNGYDKLYEIGKNTIDRVFWPLFPDNAIAVGEYVYVVFEDSRMQHGLWLCRCPSPDTPRSVVEAKEVVENPDKTAEKVPDKKLGEKLGVKKKGE